MDEARRKTLETLLEFSKGDDPRDCWDPSRAVELLRNQSTPLELREIGVDESVIAMIWPEKG